MIVDMQLFQIPAPLLDIIYARYPNEFIIDRWFFYASPLDVHLRARLKLKSILNGTIIIYIRSILIRLPSTMVIQAIFSHCSRT